MTQEAAMRTLVVYYSRTGHTRQLASEIADRCGADLEEIQEPGSRRGAWGYLRSAWQALRHAAPPIQPAIRSPADYELVVIGTPVWNFGLAPPVRSYARQHAGEFKRVAFFCTEGGSGDRRAFEELSALCGQAPAATVAVTEKQLPTPAHAAPVEQFVARLVPA